MTAEIGGGVLALLILAGLVAAVLGRRRKRREQEEADARTMAFEPFETDAAEPQVQTAAPAPAAPAASAFAWGNSATEGEAEPEVARDDRRPGETWVERAYRGPSPGNPSVSLKARLRRAAFFDKREREAAQGLAAPVDANAGLPGARAAERELA